MADPGGLHLVVLNDEQRALAGFDPSRPLSAHEALYGLSAALDPFYAAVYGAVLAAAREPLAYPEPPPIEATIKGELLEEALALQQGASRVLASVADRRTLDEQRSAFEDSPLLIALERCLVAVVNLLDVSFPTKLRAMRSASANPAPSRGGAPGAAEVTVLAR